MAPECVVAVLGGNAFASNGATLTMAGQLRFAHDALSRLLPLFAPGRRVLLSHGNGPQVGHILVRAEEALGKAYAIPLEVCVAESEGELGYVLELTLHNVLAAHGMRRPIASLITQVVVDPRDPAFLEPTKPIGPYYRADQAELLQGRGLVLRRDPKSGLLRRVVPSPAPLEVIEAPVVKSLLFELDAVVIAAGGGGVPVVREGSELRGVEAVIDKDRTAAVLADAIGADLLLIVTDVPCAYRCFLAAGQAPIGRITAGDARALLEAGTFGAGNMAPKIESAIRFCSRPGRRAIICSLDTLQPALEGTGGTIVQAG